MNTNTLTGAPYPPSYVPPTWPDFTIRTSDHTVLNWPTPEERRSQLEAAGLVLAKFLPEEAPPVPTKSLYRVYVIDNREPEDDDAITRLEVRAYGAEAAKQIALLRIADVEPEEIEHLTIVAEPVTTLPG